MIEGLLRIPPGLGGRTRLVLRAAPRERPAEAHPPDEHLVLAPGRDPRAPLPRSRPGRSVAACRAWRGSSYSTARRARPSPRTSASGIRSRSTSRADARTASRRSRISLLLPRDRGVRPGEPGRARALLGRPREASLVDGCADPVAARPRGVYLITGVARAARPSARGGVRARGRRRADAGRVGRLAAAAAARGAGDSPPRGCLDGCRRGGVMICRRGGRPAGGTANVASLGVPLVYYSTDYVFDGRKREPYFESDGPNPQSAYGRSKLHGEAAAGDEAWIIRSSWLFGPTGHNFVRTMLRLGVERDEVAVVDDQRLADLRRPPRCRDARRAAAVVWHLPRRGGRRVYMGRLRRGDLRRGRAQCRVRRISTAELRRPAPRPAYSVLRSEKARRSSRTGATACERLAAIRPLAGDE